MKRAAIPGLLFAALWAFSAVGQESILPVVRARIQPELDGDCAESLAAAMQRLSTTKGFPASFKHSRVEAVFREPWDGMARFEQLGLDVISAAGSETPITHILAQLGPWMQATPDLPPESFERGGSWQEALQFIRDVLKASHALREEALQNLSEGQREFMYERATQLVSNFSAQSACHEGNYDELRADLLFFSLAAERIDWAKLIAAAQILALLTDEVWLEELNELSRGQPLLETEMDGITGSLLWAEATPQGWLIIGGTGDNSYQFDQSIAALIDVGGNDSYRGKVAANDIQSGVSIVIDLAGNDSYQSHEFGLATGRVGVGILVDVGGDNHWVLAPGTGGAGFAGIGVLQTRTGDNEFAGTRWTLGAALAGIGLVLGGTGNDVYRSDIYSIGIGGPLGMGAVIDLGGNDLYRCGFRYGSGYNRSDAPDAKAGDPSYQYEGWGLGIGMGRRFYPWLTAEQEEFRLAQLAGGVGLLIDVCGEDQYESSNFSLGCGYYFGAGLKLDLAGNDRYQTGRYGNGAGAHQAIGLTIDYSGDDHYQSTGPTYHGGCAWDCSVFMCVDGGTGNDRYDLERTSGLGIADHGSLGVFADLGGDDRYAVVGGLGQGSPGSLAIFLDVSGHDRYQGRAHREDGRTLRENEQSSLFIDVADQSAPVTSGR